MQKEHEQFAQNYQYSRFGPDDFLFQPDYFLTPAANYQTANTQPQFNDQFFQSNQFDSYDQNQFQHFQMANFISENQPMQNELSQNQNYESMSNFQLQSQPTEHLTNLQNFQNIQNLQSIPNYDSNKNLFQPPQGPLFSQENSWINNQVQQMAPQQQQQFAQYYQQYQPSQQQPMLNQFSMICQQQLPMNTMAMKNSYIKQNEYQSIPISNQKYLYQQDAQQIDPLIGLTFEQKLNMPASELKQHLEKLKESELFQKRKHYKSHALETNQDKNAGGKKQNITDAINKEELTTQQKENLLIKQNISMNINQQINQTINQNVTVKMADNKEKQKNQEKQLSNEKHPNSNIIKQWQQLQQQQQQQFFKPQQTSQQSLLFGQPMPYQFYKQQQHQMPKWHMNQIPQMMKNFCNIKVEERKKKVNAFLVKRRIIKQQYSLNSQIKKVISRGRKPKVNDQLQTPNQSAVTANSQKENNSGQILVENNQELKAE